MYDKVLELAKFAKDRNQTVYNMLQDVLTKIAEGRRNRGYITLDADEIESLIRPSASTENIEVGKVIIEW